LRCDLMNWRYRSRSSQPKQKRSASANRVRKCSYGRGARSNQHKDDTTTRPCDGMNVLCEIEGRL
jgi:hypothetical protein